ncbi:MAG: nitroreductase family protein [Rhodomicrobium sp.]
MTFSDLFEARFGVRPCRGENIEHAGAAQFLERMLGRRTHRRFSDQPVPETVIDALLAVALSASSKSDFQQASIIKLKDPQKRAAIARHFPGMPWIGASPVFLVFCADPRRLEEIGRLRGHAQAQRDLEAFLNASVDAALVMQTFILAAEASGLGCCPISVIRNKIEDVASILRLPAGVFPVCGLCIGYPAGEGHISMRLPPSLTVHTDEYEEKPLEIEVEAYDKRRALRHAILREQQRNPAKFGYADFYGWSEDKARQAAEPEGAEFATYVRNTWFEL